MNCSSKFSCPLPWVHLSLEPKGTVFTCCNAYEFAPLGNVKNETLDEIFHGPAMEKIREQFLKGEVPSQCKLCVDAERLGQISLRESSLAKFPAVPTDKKPVIKYLGLRLSNLCNYACRTCSPDLSTAWHKDAALAGDKEFTKGTVKAFTSTDDFMKQLTTSVEDLEIIYIAGGEPLITPEFQSMLDFLLSKGREDIELIINTNFSKPNEKIFQLLTQFKSVTLSLSLDGMFEQGEYLRHGMNWAETESRIKDFLKNYPSIKLKLFPTVSIFNIFHISDFLDYVLTQKYFRPSDIAINPVTSPTDFNFQILPETLKKKAIKKLSLFQIFLLTTYKEPEDQGLAAQVKGLINTLEENFVHDQMSRFLHEVRKFDRIRGQDAFAVFPELSELNAL
ncbi:MAG: twitch domain-containing radical SAM protein [Bdellovibrionota bacterium]